MAFTASDEADLAARIRSHLETRRNGAFVGAVWQGYLAGLLEWGLIDGNAHARLSGLLPKDASLEVIEVMLGADYVASHPELAAEARAAAGSGAA